MAASVRMEIGGPFLSPDYSFVETDLCTPSDSSLTLTSYTGAVHMCTHVCKVPLSTDQSTRDTPLHSPSAILWPASCNALQPGDTSACARNWGRRCLANHAKHISDTGAGYVEQVSVSPHGTEMSENDDGGTFTGE